MLEVLLKKYITLSHVLLINLENIKSQKTSIDRR